MRKGDLSLRSRSPGNLLSDRRVAQGRGLLPTSDKGRVRRPEAKTSRLITQETVQAYRFDCPARGSEATACIDLRGR